MAWVPLQWLAVATVCMHSTESHVESLSGPAMVDSVAARADYSLLGAFDGLQQVSRHGRWVERNAAEPTMAQCLWSWTSSRFTPITT